MKSREAFGFNNRHCADTANKVFIANRTKSIRFRNLFNIDFLQAIKKIFSLQSKFYFFPSSFEGPVNIEVSMNYHHDNTDAKHYWLLKYENIYCIQQHNASTNKLTAFGAHFRPKNVIFVDVILLHGKNGK